MLLRFGSTGEAVRNVQGALNLAGRSVFEDLETDGQFGGLTQRRVREFQGQNRLQADGIVGNKTHAALDTYLKAFLDHIKTLIAPQDEARVRQRIVDIAAGMYRIHGFRHLDKLGQDRNRISCNNWYHKPTLERQGGAALAQIAALTGSPNILPHNCLTLDHKAKAAYDRDEEPIDIGKWCVAFVFACYRLAGLKVGTWPMATSGTPAGESRKRRGLPLIFDHVTKASDIKPGDFGVWRWADDNHHFLVVDATNDMLETIEGNVPVNVGGVSHRTITRRRRFSAKQVLYDHTSGFGRPVWSRVM